MRIDQDTLDKLAELAALEPRCLDTAFLAAELERIVGYCSLLDTLPEVDSREKASNSRPQRRDQAYDVLIGEDVLANAPRVIDNHFAVPPVRPAVRMGSEDD